MMNNDNKYIGSKENHGIYQVILLQDVFEHWCSFGSAKGLATDSEIAKFLLFHYKRTCSAQSTPCCISCKALLPLLCLQCSHQSQVITAQTAASSENYLLPLRDHISMSAACESSGESNFDDCHVISVTKPELQVTQPELELAFRSQRKSLKVELDSIKSHMTDSIPSFSTNHHNISTFPNGFHPLTDFSDAEPTVQSEMSVQQESMKSEPKQSTTIVECSITSPTSADEESNHLYNSENYPSGDPFQAQDMHRVHFAHCLVDDSSLCSLPEEGTDVNKQAAFEPLNLPKMQSETGMPTSCDIKNTCLSSQQINFALSKPGIASVCPLESLSHGSDSDNNSPGKRVRKQRNKQYKCERCNKDFTRSSNLSRHMLTHTGEKPFKCGQCDRAFLQSSTLLHHVRTHTGIKPYKCEQCNKSFSQSSNLSRHMLTHTGEKPYTCELCNKSFTQSSSLSHHRLSHSGLKPYKCPLCNKAFSNSSNLSKHKDTHSSIEPYKCGLCNKSFSRSYNLSQHMLTHIGQKRYKCEQCTKTFIQSSTLSQHKKTHTGKKSFHCPQCNKSFLQSSNLSRHILTHTGLKPHTCEQCGKSFAQKSSLSQHMLSHAGEKPYICGQCSKSFSQSSNLLRHMLIHLRKNT